MDADTSPLADKFCQEVFPLPAHIERVLHDLFTRKHKVGDVLYRVTPAKIPEYWRIVRYHSGCDIFTLQKLATIRLFGTGAGALYDWSRDVHIHEYKEMPSFVLDARTSTLVDANQPVMIC